VGKFALLIALLLANGRVYASEHCDKDVLESIGGKLGISKFGRIEDGGRIVADTCEIWPGRDNMLLAAFAFDPDASTVDANEKKELLILMADRKSNDVLARHMEEVALDSLVEFGEDSLSLDTAEYDLTSTVHAFGLKFHSIARGPSCAGVRSNDLLKLFVPLGDKLVPLFAGSLSTERAKKGCIGAATGHDQWESATSTISMSKSYTKGYADIVVKAKITAGDNGDPISVRRTPKSRAAYYTLRFDGKKYVGSAKSPWWFNNSEW
jgi:hypothetical protein